MPIAIAVDSRPETLPPGLTGDEPGIYYAAQVLRFCRERSDGRRRPTHQQRTRAAWHILAARRHLAAQPRPASEPYPPGYDDPAPHYEAALWVTHAQSASTRATVARVLRAEYPDVGSVIDAITESINAR